MSDKVIEVPIRLTREQIVRYTSIARAARTDLNTVLCVVLALSVAHPTKPKPRKSPTPPRKR